MRKSLALLAFVAALLAVGAFVLKPTALAQEDYVVIDDFENLTDQGVPDDAKWQVWAWEDQGSNKSTSTVQAKKQSQTVKDGKGALEIDYAFASNKATQVHVDRAIQPTQDIYDAVQFWLFGDGSGNTAEIWFYSVSAKDWRFQKRITLDFKGWKQFTAPLIDTLSDDVNRFRVVIVQSGGIGQFSLYLDDVRFVFE